MSKGAGNSTRPPKLEYRRSSSTDLHGAADDSYSVTDAGPSRPISALDSRSGAATPSTRSGTNTPPPLQHTKSEPARRNDEENNFGASSRFKVAAQRIQLIRNLSSAGGRYDWSHDVHTEPGLDAKKMDLDEEQLNDSGEGVEVDICDISSERFERVTTVDEEFGEFLTKERPNWSRIRWINVDGLSWKVMKPLALKYDLHPLALEDALHVNTEARSKADYYARHLFLKVISYTLAPPESEDDPQVEDEANITTPNTDKRPRRFTDMFRRRSSVADAEFGRSFRRRSSVSENPFAPSKSREKTLDRIGAKFRASNEAKRAVQELTEDYKIKIHTDHMSIFLLRDGTLISVMRNGRDMLQPIYRRLATADTILREKEDSSMLLQALLDLIVDNMRGVTEAYRTQLTQLEASVLANPNAETVRHLHVLSADLLMLRRGLTPLQNVVYALRRYDQERSIASRPATAATSAPVVATPAVERPNPFGNSTGLLPTALHNNGNGNLSPAMMNGGNQQQIGFLSMQARVYFSDVHDHLDEVTSALELFSSLAENLVEYTFNMINFNMNESMRGNTVVFLPLTVLTGYFGMNFTGFGEIEGSVSYFWKLAALTVFLAVVIFCGGWILDELRRLKRIFIRNRAPKRIKL